MSQQPQGDFLTGDLPTWMRPKHNQVDYVLLAVLTLCCILALPWLGRAGLPHSPESEAQIARIVAVEQALQSGVLYPRWTDFFHFGYGAPLFNYLPPLPHYLGGLYLLLGQGSPESSFKFVAVLSIFMSGLGMMAFARARWGALASLYAAYIYLLAPPLLYNAGYIMADLGLLLAAALWPCLLWAMERVLRYQAERDLPLVSVFAALLLLSAPLIAPLMLVLTGLWLAWITVFGDYPRRVSLMLLIGLGLGLGAAGIYWIPLVGEREAVHWLVIHAAARPLSLIESLSLTYTRDPQQFNLLPIGLIGPVVWGLGLLGALYSLWQLAFGDKGRLRMAALGALFWALVGLLIFYVAVLWPNDWLDDLAQFPSLSRLDLLLLLAFCGALVGAQVVLAIEQFIQVAGLRFIGLSALMLVVVWASYDLLNPPPFRPYRAGDAVNAYMQSELRGVYSGSLRYGHLLPRYTSELPPPSFALVESYQKGQVVKIEHGSRLPSASFAILSHHSTENRFRINTAQAVNLQVLTLYYAGWRATFDQNPVAIQTASQTGFINLDLPVGSGDLRVWMGNTPPRTVGMIVSLASLLSLAALLFVPRKFEIPATIFSERQPRLMILGVAVLGIGLMLVARVNPSRADYRATIRPTPIVFEGGLDLLGYTLDKSSARRGEIVTLELYWQAARPNLPDYQITLRLVDNQSGALMWEQVQRAPGGWPTSFWPQNRYIRDVYPLRIPSDMPSGQYSFEVRVTSCQDLISIYTCAQAIPLGAYDPRGGALGDRYQVTDLRIR